MKLLCFVIFFFFLVCYFSTWNGTSGQDRKSMGREEGRRRWGSLGISSVFLFVFYNCFHRWQQIYSWCNDSLEKMCMLQTKTNEKKKVVDITCYPLPGFYWSTDVLWLPAECRHTAAHIHLHLYPTSHSIWGPFKHIWFYKTIYSVNSMCLTSVLMKTKARLCVWYNWKQWHILHYHRETESIKRNILHDEAVAKCPIHIFFSSSRCKWITNVFVVGELFNQRWNTETSVCIYRRNNERFVDYSYNVYKSSLLCFSQQTSSNWTE